MSFDAGVVARLGPTACRRGRDPKFVMARPKPSAVGGAPAARRRPPRRMPWIVVTFVGCGAGRGAATAGISIAKVLGERQQGGSMPRRARDVVGSVVTLIALVALLAAFDRRVCDSVQDAIAQARRSNWNSPAERVEGVFATVRSNPYVDNAYLAVFLVVGGVLVFLMLRT
jgi:hypothetical protein